MNTNTKFHVIWAKRLKFVKILSSLELNVGSSDRGRNQLGLGLGLDPSVISRLFCVGRSPELVISRPFGALPSGCWWSTDFCWWVPVIADDLPTFAGEFPSAGDLPTFWWSPDFFLVMSWPLVISRLFLPLLTLLVLDHPNYGWIDWNFHKMLNNVC